MTRTSLTCLPAFSHPCISHCLGDLLSLSLHLYSTPCLLDSGNRLIFQASAALIKVTDDLCVTKPSGHFCVCLLGSFGHIPHTCSHLPETSLSAAVMPHSPPPMSLATPSPSFSPLFFHALLQLIFTQKKKTKQIFTRSLLLAEPYARC